MGFFFLAHCERCRSIQYFGFKICSYSKDDKTFEVEVRCNRCGETFERRVEEQKLSQEIEEMGPFILHML